jgi:hypothetical protein
MSFTSAGLLVRESLILAQAYQSIQDWDQLKTESFEQNLLQTKKPSSAKRNIREISHRLRTLTPDQFELLIDGGYTDQLHILWLATAKTYRFIHEFSQEVVREKYLKLDYMLSYDDFDSFFNAKAEWDDGLDGLSESTRKKIRQVLFRMMHEAEILTAGNMIIPTILSAETARVIQADDPALFVAYPVSDMDIQEWTL